MVYILVPSAVWQGNCSDNLTPYCLQREGNIVEYYVLLKFNAFKVFQLFRFRTEQTSQLAWVCQTPTAHLTSEWQVVGTYVKSPLLETPAFQFDKGFGPPSFIHVQTDMHQLSNSPLQMFQVATKSGVWLVCTQVEVVKGGLRAVSGSRKGKMSVMLELERNIERSRNLSSRQIKTKDQPVLWESWQDKYT